MNVDKLSEKNQLSQLAMARVKNVDLKLDIDVLTKGSVSEFVNSILEFLLYQRRQIPFVYNTYKYYVENWADQTDVETARPLNNYQLQQHRKKARATKDAISNMRELIRNTFKNSAVKTLRFLFGSNTFMPQEAYTIHIPTITGLHYSEHHAMPSHQINQTLIKLITCDDLHTLFSTELTATNIFLEMELLTHADEQLSQFEAVKLYPKDVLSQLPRSCKNVHFNLIHENETQLQCCNELVIYEDLSATELKRPQEQNVAICNTTEQSHGWWQADVVVRGFRAPSKASFNLWSS